MPDFRFQRLMFGSFLAVVLVIPGLSGAQPSGTTEGGSTDGKASSNLTICRESVAPPPGESSVKRTDGQISNVVQSLSQRIYSPYCPGKTLAMCPSGGAAAVRRDIQRLAAQGWSLSAIEATILEACGEEYRLEEPPPEDNYFLIGLVIAGLFICLGAVWAFTRQRSAGDDDPDDSDPGESLDPRDEARLDEIRREYRE